MAFLEDLGRTNQLAVSTGNLVNLSRQMRSDERADKLAEQQGAANAVQLEVSKIQLDKVKKEEAFNNQVMTIDQVFGSVPTLANSPTAQKHLLDLAGPALVDVNGVKGITRGDLNKVMQGVQTNVEFQKVLSEALLQDHVAIKTQLTQQLQDPKLKPEQAQQLKQQLAQNEQTLSTILTNRKMLDTESTKREAEIKLLEAKAKTEGAQADYYNAKANEPSGSAGGGKTVFERAYNQFILENPDNRIGMAEFKAKYWMKQTPSGAPVSDAEALKRIEEFAEFDKPKTNAGFKEYIRFKKGGASSSEALGLVAAKFGNTATTNPPATDQLKSSHSSTNVGVQKDFSALWKY